MYVVSASRSESLDVDLVGPAALLDREFHDRGRRVWALLLFVFAAYAIFASAEPFAESLVHIGRNREVDEFLLVQWVAPLASESPEFLIAILFVVFDVETMFLFPWAVVLADMGLFGYIEMFVFIVLLLVGFIYAWVKGALEWES